MIRPSKHDVPTRLLLLLEILTSGLLCHQSQYRMKVQASTIAALAGMFAASVARPAAPDHVLHEARPVLSESTWVKASRIENDLRVPVTIR